MRDLLNIMGRTKAGGMWRWTGPRARRLWKLLPASLMLAVGLLSIGLERDTAWGQPDPGSASSSGFPGNPGSPANLPTSPSSSSPGYPQTNPPATGPSSRPQSYPPAIGLSSRPQSYPPVSGPSSQSQSPPAAGLPGGASPVPARENAPGTAGTADEAAGAAAGAAGAVSSTHRGASPGSADDDSSADSGSSSPPVTPAPRPARPETSSAAADVDRTTPRQTVAGYQDAAEAHDWRRAARFLDLRGIPPGERYEEGPTLAAQLETVIARTRWLVTEDLPDDPAPKEGDRLVLFQFSRRNVRADVSLQKVGSRWLFSRETVRNIPAMYDTIDDAWLREQLPGELFRQFLGLAFWQWIGLAALLVLGFLVGSVAPSVLTSSLKRLAARRRLDISLPSLQTLAKPLATTLEVILLYFGVQALLLPARLEQVLSIGLRLLIVLAVLRLAYRGVDVLQGYLTRLAQRTETRMDDQAVPLIIKLTRGSVLVVMAFWLLRELNVDVWSLVAGLGIGGLAVALAAKDTLANFFGSLNIFFDRPFQIGDYVITGTLEGTIEEIGFRTTRLRTATNSVISIPNADLATRAVENMSARSKMRVQAVLRLLYSTTPEQIDAFIQTARTLLRENPQLEPDGQQVFLSSLGTEAIEVTVQFFVKGTEFATFIAERQRMLVALMRAVREVGTWLALPGGTAHLDSDGGDPNSRGAGTPANERPDGPAEKSTLTGETARPTSGTPAETGGEPSEPE